MGVDTGHVKEHGPYTESGGEVILDRDKCGFSLGGVLDQHVIQMTNDDDGGTWSCFGWGPAGKWDPIETGLEEGETTIVDGKQFPRIRLATSGTGGTAQFYVRSTIRRR